MRVILHIGMHKTGSTSLQKQLVNVNARLNKLDWNYLYNNPVGNSSVLVDIEYKDKSIFYVVNNKIEELLSEAKSAVNILSGEHFFAISDGREVQRLHHILSQKFNEIEVVVYLRRQDKVALSFKQQATKGNRKDVFLSSMLCGHSSAALPELIPNLKTYLSYSQKLEMWAKVFGAKNIKVLDFDNLYEKDICADFSRAVNMPFKLKSLRSNEGVSRLASLVLHRLLERGSSSRLIAKIRGGFKEYRGDKVLPKRSEAKAFYDAFSVENERLLEYGVAFAQDFSYYPEENQYEFELGDIENILEVISSIDVDNKVDNNDIDVLRDLALSYEASSNIKMAYKLMLIVQKLRPRGPLIKKKVAEYEEKLGIQAK
ncbi:MAG: hypothetical protein ABJE79_00855 [Marinomonas sp.]